MKSILSTIIIKKNIHNNIIRCRNTKIMSGVFTI